MSSYANWVEVPVIDLSDEEPQLDGERGGTIDASGVSTGETGPNGPNGPNGPQQAKEVREVNAVKPAKRALEMVHELEPERAKRPRHDPNGCGELHTNYENSWNCNLW